MHCWAQHSFAKSLCFYSSICGWLLWLQLIRPLRVFWMQAPSLLLKHMHKQKANSIKASDLLLWLSYNRSNHTNYRNQVGNHGLPALWVAIKFIPLCPVSSCLLKLGSTPWALSPLCPGCHSIFRDLWANSCSQTCSPGDVSQIYFYVSVLE